MAIRSEIVGLNRGVTDFLQRDQLLHQAPRSSAGTNETRSARRTAPLRYRFSAISALNSSNRHASGTASPDWPRRLKSIRPRNAINRSRRSSY